jgi:hypothetical protein
MRSRRPSKIARTAPPPVVPVSGGPHRSHRRRFLIGAAVLVAGFSAVVLSWSSTSAPGPPNPTEQPPVAFAPLPALSASAFRNTKSGVAYVGDAVCLNCHTGYASYRDHPMGRSLFRTEGAPPLEQFDAKGGTAFRTGPFRFEVLREGKKQIHREWCEDARGTVVAEQRVEMNYAVGSGTQGRSYLYDRDGFLFESPITWYAQRAGWHASPGYESHPLHFTRRIDARCLYCHAHESRPIEHTINRYQEPPFGQLAIGCERCHGPGAVHATANRPAVPPGAVDDTIVNPKHLAALMRDAICEQCHLQGEVLVPRRGRSQSEYRPGLPLHEYVLVFVRPPELAEHTRIVGHAEQMRQSACYAKSRGQFGCTSCHDPHRAPGAAEAVAFYQDRCRTCHAPTKPPPPGRIVAPDCSVPPGKRVTPDGRGDCLVCHMPRNSSVTNQHLAVTDHRVLRTPTQVRVLRSNYRPGNLPLVPFHQHLLAADDPDVPRDLALAAIELADQAKRDGALPVSEFLVRSALPLLDRASARDAGDVRAQEARGYALLDRHRPEEALTVFESVLARAPDREQTLIWATEAALVLDRLDAAEGYCRRLIEKYTHNPGNHERLAAVLVKRRLWPEALAAARAAVRGNPFRPPAREHLIAALIATGDFAAARTEFNVVGVLDPAHQAKLRDRFPDQFRDAK